MGGTPRPIVKDLSQGALVKANEENVLAYSAWARRAPDVEIDDRPGRFRVHMGISHAVFNGVRSARLPPSEADAYLDETFAYFASKGEPWSWWIWPGSTPVNLGDRLTARGLVHRGSFPAMSIDLRSLGEGGSEPEGLTIARVPDASGLEEWVQIAGAVFGLAEGAPRRRYVEVYSHGGLDEASPMQFYTGHVGSLPVAASQVFLAAGVAGIYTVATLREHRGRGYGTALTAAPLREARLRGYRWGILQATEMGKSVYLRMGFRHDADIAMYGFPPPAEPTGRT